MTGAFTLFNAPEDFGAEGNLVLGPDGNFWYPATASTSQLNTNIVRFTPAGVKTVFKVPKVTFRGVGTEQINPNSVTVGVDGNIWFGSFNCTIGSVSTSGHFHMYVLGPDNCFTTVGAATQSGVWFTNTGTSSNTCAVGFISSTGTVSQFMLPGGYDFLYPAQIVQGPDGNLWFAADSYVGQVTPSGSTMNFFPASPVSAVISITSGPDGNLWFIGNELGKMNTTGQVLQTFNDFGGDYNGGYYLTSGADGNIWLTDAPGLRAGVARVTPSGLVTQFYLPNKDSGFIPLGIAVGPDLNIWFSTYGRGGGPDPKGMGRFAL